MRAERSFSTLADLHWIVDVLVSTPGVRDFRITAGRPPKVSYEYSASPPSFGGSPMEEDDLPWEERVLRLNLRSYTVRTLLEGVVHGWSALRELGRYPTHLCVWSAKDALLELFPDVRWSSSPAIRETVFGMELVELGDHFSRGAVILCGGPRIGGSAREVDTGLSIVRPLKV